MRVPGGPLAADGVVMQGLASQAPGGGLIVAFDAETGEKLWEFETVAKPGQPGGDTWNGLPGDQRRGGSQWTSGTYDAGQRPGAVGRRANLRHRPAARPQARR